MVPFAAVALIATASAVIRSYWSALLVVHLVLACHGELYRRRPLLRCGVAAYRARPRAADIAQLYVDLVVAER
jgi:hypothetical protein